MIRILTNDGLQQGAVDKLVSMGFKVVNTHYDKDVLGEVLKDFDVLVIRSADFSPTWNDKPAEAEAVAAMFAAPPVAAPSITAPVADSTAFGNIPVSSPDAPFQQ